MNWIYIVLINCLLAMSVPAFSGNSLLLNSAKIHNPPKWMNINNAEKPILKIESKLEWNTRRINVHFYTSKEAYLKSHNLGAGAVAVTKTKASQISVHLSPKVNKSNYPQIMAHEMVHVILKQKYRQAIPKFLEEGLANHLAGYQKVDYKWLSQQAPIKDVTKLSHPFNASKARISYRYKASQALAEMLQKKCDLENLIRLSVGRKMENYIQSYCGIKDLNQSFRSWVKEKAKSQAM